MRLFKKVALVGVMLGTVGGFICGRSRSAEALPAQEVETTYFSDATFSVEVGFSVLACNGGHSRSGRTTRYMVKSTMPCNYRGSDEVACFVDNIPTTCPPSLCDSGLFDCQ
jgi:hypothetical protein